MLLYKISGVKWTTHPTGVQISYQKWPTKTPPDLWPTCRRISLASRPRIKFGNDLAELVRVGSCYSVTGSVGTYGREIQGNVTGEYIREKGCFDRKIVPLSLRHELRNGRGTTCGFHAFSRAIWRRRLMRSGFRKPGLRWTHDLRRKYSSFDVWRSREMHRAIRADRRRPRTEQVPLGSRFAELLDCSPRFHTLAILLLFPSFPVSLFFTVSLSRRMPRVAFFHSARTLRPVWRPLSYPPINCPTFIDELSFSSATSHRCSLFPPFVDSAIEKFQRRTRRAVFWKIVLLRDRPRFCVKVIDIFTYVLGQPEAARSSVLVKFQSFRKRRHWCFTQ